MRGRLALGDVPCAVHADEDERNAARLRPLQHGQPVAHRLEAHAEALAQALDVVALFLGGAQEGRVRHEQRPGKVVGQADARELPRLAAGQARVLRQAAQHGFHLQEGQLRGHVEVALPALQPVRQVEHVGGRIEQAQRAAFKHRHLRPRRDHAHAVLLLQPLQQQAFGAARLHAPLRGAVLGGGVQLGHVVVVGEEIVAHLLVGHGRRRLAALARALVAPGRGERIKAFERLAVAPVQADEGARHGGHAGGQLADLGQRHLLLPRAARRLVGQHLVQTGDQARLLVVGKALHVHAQRGADLEQHRHRQRALVLLDLVQVAGRQAQRARQRHLREAALLAQAAQLHAHEGLAHGVVSGLFANFAICGFFLRKPSPIQCLHWRGGLRTLRIMHQPDAGAQPFLQYRRTTP